MGVVYRKDRGTWGYRKSYHGKLYRESQWPTKAEAERAYAKFLVELKNEKKIPENAFITLVNEYLIHSKKRGRSDSRVKALRWNFDRFIVPFFKPYTLAAEIAPEDIEAFITKQKQRVSANTVWHYIVDIRALFNWAIKQQLLTRNPVAGANLDALKDRFKAKLPLDPALVERAAECLVGVERVYFDFVRFTGARKDEANRVECRISISTIHLLLFPAQKRRRLMPFYRWRLRSGIDSPI